MKYFLILLPFLLIYVFTKPEETIEIKATTPPDKVEDLHIDNRRPTPAPRENRALASWYDRSACGDRIYGSTCKTANGEIFDESKYTLACAGSFRLGDILELCYLDKCVTAICSDRGAFGPLGRTFDLSPATFSVLADLNKGVIEVSWDLKSK